LLKIHAIKNIIIFLSISCNSFHLKLIDSPSISPDCPDYRSDPW